MNLNYCQYESYREQVFAEQMAWHTAKNPALTEKQIEAYRAGFDQGWRGLMSALKLHAKIKIN